MLSTFFSKHCPLVLPHHGCLPMHPSVHPLQCWGDTAALAGAGQRCSGAEELHMGRTCGLWGKGTRIQHLLYACSN